MKGFKFFLTINITCLTVDKYLFIKTVFSSRFFPRPAQVYNEAVADKNTCVLKTKRTGECLCPASGRSFSTVPHPNRGFGTQSNYTACGVLDVLRCLVSAQ